MGLIKAIDKKYVCEYCKKKFKSEEELNAHRREYFRKAYFMYALSADVDIVGGYLATCTVEKKGVMMLSDGWGPHRIQCGKLESIDKCFNQVLAETRNADYERVYGKYNSENPNQKDIENFGILLHSKSEFQEAYVKLMEVYEAYCMKKIDRCVDEDINGVDNKTKQSPLQQLIPMAHEFLDKMIDESNGIAEMIEKSNGKLELSIDSNNRGRIETSFGQEYFNVKNKKNPTSPLGLLEGIYDRWLKVQEAEQAEKEALEKKKKEGKPKYEKDDLFLMIFKINWADDIDFEFSDVITGEQREKLENLAKKGNTCHICFGTNQQGEYDGEKIMECISFNENKMTKKEYDVISKFGLAHVGNKGYSDIIDGFELNEEEIKEKE